MIQLEHFSLDNGLQVVVHEDPRSLVVGVNVMYQVGAKDEDPARTGIAHFLEHLMFSGSKHIPVYDTPLQAVGGSNNAYTSSDVTSYHCTVPASNLETAFWLESDRMFALSLHPTSFAIQKKVVMEEFKEIHLNQPYGDAWLLLSSLAYVAHPYQWPIIGKSIDDIHNITLEETRNFYKNFYVPNNAVLAVAGGVKTEAVKQLSKKWFGTISSGSIVRKAFPIEPPQTLPRIQQVERRVPLDALYLAYHTPGMLDAAYPALELLCTGLGVGKSSRLYQKLVVELSLFNTIEAYLTETIAPNLLVITGTINEGVSLEKAEHALKASCKNLQEEGLSQEEFTKAKNHLIAASFYKQVDIDYRAEELAFGTLLGKPNWVNMKKNAIENVAIETAKEIAQRVLAPNAASILRYKSI